MLWVRCLIHKPSNEGGIKHNRHAIFLSIFKPLKNTKQTKFNFTMTKMDGYCTIVNMNTVKALYKHQPKVFTFKQKQKSK